METLRKRLMKQVMKLRHPSFGGELEVRAAIANELVDVACGIDTTAMTLVEALKTDGAPYKQWYIERALLTLGYELPIGTSTSIAP